MALQQSTELREVFLRVYEGMETGDVGLILDLMSRDAGVLVIGTDPDEWWSDFATIEQVYTVQLNEMRESGVTFQTGDPQCYQEGSVGWCADRGTMVLPDGTQQPVRLTAIFHQEGGDWKMVHSHVSLGVPNEQAFGTDVTT